MDQGRTDDAGEGSRAAGAGPVDDDTWLTLPEAASAVRVSVSALRKWYTSGDIPSRMGPGPTGERRYVPLEAVAERARRTAPVTPPTPTSGPAAGSVPDSAEGTPVGSVPEGYALVPKSVADAVTRVLEMLPAFQEAGERIGRMEAERDIFRERLDDARRAQREAETDRDRLAREIEELRTGQVVAASPADPTEMAVADPPAPSVDEPGDAVEAEPSVQASGGDTADAPTAEVQPQVEALPVADPSPGEERSAAAEESFEAANGAFGTPADRRASESVRYTESFLAAGPMTILQAREPERLTEEGRRFLGFLRWSRPLRWITYPLDRLHRFVGPTVFPVIVLSLLVAAAIVWFAAEAGPARTGVAIGLVVVGLLGAINVGIAILFDRYLGEAVRSTLVRRSFGSLG